MNPGEGGVLSKWIFLPILLVMYTPLVLIRKTEKLAFTHLLSDIIIMFVITSACIFGGIEFSKRGNQHLVSMAYQNVAGIGTGISSATYAFEGIAVVLPVREITKDKENYYRLLCITITFIAIFYILFA